MIARTQSVKTDRGNDESQRFGHRYGEQISDTQNERKREKRATIKTSVLKIAAGLKPSRLTAQ
jgi:hypothetical protein